MFSFLRKKIPLNKSTTAKIFAVVMVCFWVYGSVNSAFAVSEGLSNLNGSNHYYKDYTSNDVYLRADSSVSSGLEGADANSSTYYKVSKDNSLTPIERPANAPYGWDPIPKTTTPLPYNLNPQVLNQQDNTSGLSYDYEKGQYVYGEGPNAEYIDPANTARLSELQKVVSQDYSSAAKKAENNTAVTGNPNKQPEISCSWDNGTSCIIAKTIYYITIKPASWAVMASGWFFDIVFQKTVLCLSSTIGKSPASGSCTAGSNFYPVIQNVWSVFRDLINMTFIFVLLYTAINTILKADTAEMKKTLVVVIQAALLINFSLFFTEIIIDVSNNFAVAIYSKILGNTSSISAGIMSSLHMEKLMGAAASSSDYSGMITISIFGSIFMLILAVIFFVISILFVVRFVTFIILMMMSPVGIGGSVLPKLQEKLGGKFWTDLQDQCFFAPIFMLFLWIILRILTAISTLGGADQSTDLAGIVTGNGNTKGIGYFLLSFSVVIFLLIKALEVSKSMSASGTVGAAVQSGLLKYSGANWLDKKMRSAPASVAKNTLGVGARNLIGGGANYLAEREGFRKWSRNNPLTKGIYGKFKDVADAKFGTDKGFIGVKKDREKDELAHDKWLATLESPEQKKLREEAEKAIKEHAADKQNIDLAAANAHLKGFEENTTKGNDETEKKLEDAKKDLEAAKKLATNPTMSEAGKKLAEEKIASKEKTISDLEKQKKNEVGEALTKAFKNINVEVSPENPASLDAAKKQLAYLSNKRKENDTEGSGNHQFSDMQSEIENGTLEIKKLEEIAKEQLRVSAAASHELKNIKANTTDQQKITRIQYAQGLKDRRLGIIPRSAAAKGAAKAIEKEIYKGQDKIDQEKMIKSIAKALKESGEIKEESKPTPPPPPITK